MSLVSSHLQWCGSCGKLVFAVVSFKKNEDDTGTEGRMLMILQLQLSPGQRLEMARSFAVNISLGFPANAVDDKEEEARLDDEPVEKIPWSLSHLECGCLCATVFRISRYGGMGQNLKFRIFRSQTSDNMDR